MLKKAFLFIAVLVFVGAIFASGIDFSQNSNKLDPYLLKRFAMGDKFVQTDVYFSENSGYFDERQKNILISKFGNRVVRNNYPLGFSALLSEREVFSLERDMRVKKVDYSYNFRTNMEEVVDIIDVEDVWPIEYFGEGLDGTGESICIVDTGIDFTNPDLTAKNVVGSNVNCLQGGADCIIDSGTTDLNGHGTRMAGVAAADGGVIGVARGSDLVGLKIFPGSDSSGRIGFEVVKAIEWCVDNKDTYNISVISMSIGTDVLFSETCDGTAFDNAVLEAVDNGIAVVAATGNDGSSTEISLPGCVPNVIPVAATDKSDNLWSGSNYNSIVKLFAPGVSVLTTDIGGTGFSTGTSPATAATAGAIAVLNQLMDLGEAAFHPKNEIEPLLFENADSINGLPAKWKRLNILNTVMSFETTVPKGDVNVDGVIDVSDPILLIAHINGLESIACEDLGDVDDDDDVEPSDHQYLLNYVFGIGPAPIGESNCFILI